MSDSVYQDDVLGEDVPFVPEVIPSSYRPSPASAYTSAAPRQAAPQRDDEMQGILRGMLKQSQTDVQGALTSDKVAEQQYLDSQAWKKKTLQESYDKLVAQKKDPSEFLLAFGAGMLKPTKTGSFFESLGNAGEAGVPALSRMNQLEQANKKTGLEYQLGMAGTDTDMAKYRGESAQKRAALSQKQGDTAVSMMDRISAREQAQQLARERMGLMELLARDRLDAGKAAADAKTAASTTSFIQSLDTDGKHVLATLGGPSVLETPEGVAKFQQALREYSGMAEEPPEQRKERLVTMGLPDMVADPFAGLPVKKRAEAQTAMLKMGQTELDKAQGTVDTARKLRENGRRFLEVTTGLDTGAMFHTPGSIALNPKAREAANIATNMAPDFRNGLPGAASDTDVKMFAAGAPSLTNSRTANNNLVTAYSLAAENAENQHAFKEAYLAQHKTLVGANSAWMRYLKDNPIFEFDEKAVAAGNAEAYRLNGARADWQTYFREEVRPTQLPPATVAALNKQLTPGNGATLDDGSVWTKTSSGKLKRVR